MRGLGMSRMGRLAMAGAALSLGEIIESRPDVMPSKKRQRTSARYIAPRRTTFHATNGKRECERRQRQIAAGSLRVENGLDMSGTVLSPKARVANRRTAP